jgi:hypothetical protein
VVRVHPAVPEKSSDLARVLSRPKGWRKPINAEAEMVATLPTFRESARVAAASFRWAG